jgi:hypothetical protein
MHDAFPPIFHAAIRNGNVNEAVPAFDGIVPE